MSHHKHLTLEERERIMYLIAQGKSITYIANKLGRNKSTISRELRRNENNGEYIPSLAQRQYETRRKRCRPHIKLSGELYRYVKDKFLNHQWSPEQIAGRLKYENAQDTVSYTTIYRGIYAGLFDDPNKSHGNRGVIRKLRHRGKSRHTRNYEEKRGKIQISNMIDSRPEEANNRSRLGDWEADTVLGKKGKACIVSLVDRKSRYLLGGKSENKTADKVNEVIKNKLEGEPLKSITPDRGKEFSNHKEITEHFDGVQFYFPHPHHPWERGTNENTNGLIREYFPKGFDISNITDEYIQQQFYEINTRPRKCLGFKTPYEVYKNTTLRLV